MKIILDKHRDCKITFVRELTKKNEEVLNMDISELIKIFERRKILGEITFILEPSSNDHDKDFSN